MKKIIAYSSETYLLNVEDVLKLKKSDVYFDNGKVCILLGDKDKEINDTLLSGHGLLKKAQKNGEKFVFTNVAYYTLPSYLSMFVNLIKPLKRKYYGVGTEIYRTLLSDLDKRNLSRGERNSQNAYQWTKGKAWSFSEEERKKRYENLYNSIKEKGYDYNYPMHILLNRAMGVKDQILQGHHRIGICKELGVDEVSVRFWYSPKSPNFMKIINNFVVKIKRKKP